MAEGRGRRLLTLALSTCVLAAGVAGFVLELRPFALSAVSAEERLAVLSEATAASGLSYEGRRRVMLACLDFGDSLFMRAQPSRRRAQLMSGCDEAATRFVASMPTFSEAWLVKAKVAAEAADVTALSRNVEKSRASAPHVQWLAGERMRLRERVRGLSADPAFTEALDAGQRDDVMTLMGYNDGSKLLAEQYARDPAFRGRLTAIAEQAPMTEQQLLLAHIREVMRR